MLGNLRQAALDDGTVVSYAVDGANRRIRRSVNGVPAQGFLYQGQLRVVAELDGAGTVVSRFVYGTGVNVPDYLVRGGTTYRLVTDHLGSVRLVVDATTGAIAQQLDYDPFGRVVLDTNPGFQPFAFAGGLYDPLTGLVRFGARDYDAETGRWTSRDPIGFGGGDTSLYGYVLGDPINSFDPVGLYTLDGFLRVVSDFSAGFGDTLTSGFGLVDRSLTERIREALPGDVNAVVDPCSGAYLAGQAGAFTWGAAIGTLGVARVFGWQTRVALHGPHHEFGSLGRLSHFQLNYWRIGVRDSGRAWRIPLPWR